MSRYRNYQLLTPPRKEDEIYPYRRVWPSIVYEMAGVFGIAVVTYIAIGFAGIQLPDGLTRLINLLIAIAPALLWLVFSRYRERFVTMPRRGLLSVFVISALVANAIGIPLTEYIAPEQWLSRSGLFGKILGYAVTIGVTHETLKYLVIHYAVWPNRFRERLDAVAFAAASAFGYATVLNLHFALGSTLSPDIVAFRVFSFVAIEMAASVIVAYGFSVILFTPRSFLMMPFTLIAACLIHGLGVSARSGLVNAGFFLGIAGTRPLFGLIISLIIVIGVLFIMAFLFANAERQEKEAISSREGQL